MQSSWDALQLSLLSAPFSPSLLSFFPTSLCINNLLWHSYSAGQFSLVSISVLPCSDLLCHCRPPYTSHWSLSAELSITLPPAPFLSQLSPTSPPSPCCLISYFSCQRFASDNSERMRCFSSAKPLSVENTGCVHHQEDA